MRIRIATAAVLIAALCPAAATAEAATTVRFTETQVTNQLSAAGGFPAVGGTQVNAGTITTASFGKGDKAQVNTVRITGQSSATTFTFTVRGTDFFAAGTQRWTGGGTGTVNADGSFTATGRGRYVGGTGRYRGARGRFTFSATQAAGTTVQTARSRGTIRF
jgi:hypothetical protein